MMYTFLNRYKFCFLGIFLIAADFFTKKLALTYCLITKDVMPFISCKVLKNYGVSFGLFNQYKAVANYIIALFIILFLIFLFFLLHKYVDKNKNFLGEVLILAGGIGNLIDRIFYGYIIDFISIHNGNFRFPYYFNFADMCIVFGALIIFYSHIINVYKEQ